MKKINTFICLLLTSAAWAQNPCASGRYATDIFPTVTTTSNVTYGSNTSWSGQSTTLKLDVYAPTGDTASKRPLIIWVHGGSFIGGSKTDGDVVALSQRFAKKGYLCASIDYRIGFFPFDSANAVKAVVRAVQDLRASLRYFYKDAQTSNTYKVDTNFIYIGGSSAGAITALHLAYLNEECEIAGYLSSTVITQLGGLEGTSGNPGYSSKVNGVINGCGALARYSWLEAGDVPLCSVHGTNDGTVKYNRGIVNPGTPLMFLDGSRMLHERACAVGLENQFYTFPNAPHVPYAGNQAYMDTTVNFIRDFLVQQMGCPDASLQPENAPLETAILYPINYCDGSPVNEDCVAPSAVNILNSFEAMIYPNPAQQTVTIVPNTDDAYTVEVFDLTGRSVLSSNKDFGMMELNLNGIAAGSYFVRISSGKASYTKQLIKL
jgi:para-nitrobenzyl esterase